MLSVDDTVISALYAKVEGDRAGTGMVSGDEAVQTAISVSILFVSLPMIPIDLKVLAVAKPALVKLPVTLMIVLSCTDAEGVAVTKVPKKVAAVSVDS